MDLQLKGKAALVTGGSRGLGRASALTLAGEGCDVAIAARTQATLDRTTAEIRERGVKAAGILADVTNPADITRMVDGAAMALGRLDILVANAGGSKPGGLLEADDEAWQFTLDINLLHAVRSIRAAVPHMRKAGGGAAVIISSVSGFQPAVPAQYGVAKAAEIFLAAALTLELAQFNIRINCVAPGSIVFEGGGWARRMVEIPDAMARFIEESFPYKRLGTDQEVANAVTFLCSPQSSWIAGTTVSVDGAQQRQGMWSPAQMPAPAKR